MKICETCAEMKDFSREKVPKSSDATSSFIDTSETCLRINAESGKTIIGEDETKLMASVSPKYAKKEDNGSNIVQHVKNGTSTNNKQMNREGNSNMVNFNRDNVVSNPSVVKILDAKVTSPARNLYIKSDIFCESQRTDYTNSHVN